MTQLKLEQEESKCKWCGRATYMRYVDYGLQGADVLLLCKKTKWKDGFPILNSCGGEEE